MTNRSIHSSVFRAAAVLSAAALLGTAAITGAGAASAASASTASAAKGPVLTVRDLPARVRLIPGESIKLVQSTNLTTGYSWHVDGGCCTPQNTNVARVSKGVYHAPQNTQGMVGVPGTTSWIITALRPGTTTFQVVTRPPGAQNTMQDETVGTLTVIVSKG
jgi:predicted secreted protein